MEKKYYKSYLKFYFIIALISASCASCYINGGLFYDLTGALFFVLKIILFFGFFIATHICYKKIKMHINKTPSKIVLNNISLSFEKESIKIMMLILLLAWLPYLIIFYPGVSNYDTANQINDFFNGTSPMPFGFVEGQEEISCFLNDHHPIITTLIMVPFVGLGRLIGYANIGMLLYVVFQMTLTAFSFAVMIGFLEKLGCPYRVRKYGFLFLALMPFIPLHVICMLKDCLYATFFVLYTVYYVAIMKKIRIGKHQLLVFVLLSLAVSLTKKTGIYLVIICNLVLLTTCILSKNRETIRKNIRNNITGIVSGIAIPVLILWVIFPLIIFPMANIYPGSKSEVYGTLFQQTAKVIVECGEDALSEEELATVGKVIDVDNIENLYYSLTTDPVKATFNMHASNEDISAYLKIWFRVGLRHPVKYIEATLSVCGGFFSPKKVIDMFDGIPVTPSEEAFGAFSNPGFLSGFRKTVDSIYYYMSETPGIDILFYIFTYIWLIPVVVFASMKNKYDRLSLLPVALSILILVVCPVCYARYAISQIYIVPLIIGLGMRRNYE